MKKNIHQTKEYCKRFCIFHCSLPEDVSLIKVIDVESEKLAAEYDFEKQKVFYPSNNFNAKYLDANEVLSKSVDLMKFRVYHESWGASLDIGDKNRSFPISFLENEKGIFVEFHAILRPCKYSSEEGMHTLSLRPYEGNSDKDRFGWMVEGLENLNVPFNQRINVELFQDYLIVEDKNLVHAIVPDVEFIVESDEEFKFKRFKTIMIDASLKNQTYELKPRSRYQRLLMAYHFARSHAYIEAMRMLSSVTHLTVFNDGEYKILTLIAFMSKLRGLMIPDLCSIEYLAAVLILYNQSIFPNVILKKQIDNNLPSRSFEQLAEKSFVKFWFGHFAIEYGSKQKDNYETLLDSLLRNYLKNATSVNISLNLSVPFACDNFWTLQQEKRFLQSYLSTNEAAIVRISQIYHLLQLSETMSSFLNCKDFEIIDTTFMYKREKSLLQVSYNLYSRMFYGDPLEKKKLELADAFRDPKSLLSLIYFFTWSSRDDLLKNMVKQFFVLIRRRLMEDQQLDKYNILQFMKQITGNEFKLKIFIYLPWLIEILFIPWNSSVCIVG